MKALRLLTKLTAYYAIAGIAIWLLLSAFPSIRDVLPIGGVEHILTKPDHGSMGLQGNEIPQVPVRGMGESLVWLGMAILGALLVSLPVSWVYMGIRTEEEYDQSLISTVLILPMVVTSIVVVVQNSLALAFSLAGIAGAVRFKNSLKSSGDALFILLAVGTGLAGGIGAVELAAVMTIAFNYCFVILWFTEYGERAGMKRYMSDHNPDNSPAPGPVAPTTTTTTTTTTAPSSGTP